MLELITASPTLLIALVFVLGLLVGSFLNVVILRLPRMLEQEWRQQAQETLGLNEHAPATRIGLARPASHCPSCGHRIRPWENIPVVSWLALRGRCSNCNARISVRYPLVELLTACLSAIVAWQFGWGWELVAGLSLTWILIALSGIDFDTQLLPDTITLSGLWLGLAFSLVPVFADPAEAILGAIAGYLSLWLVFHGFRLVTGKEGMGYGDFKLLALLGAWLGWSALPVIILLSALVGAVAGITMIAALGRDRQLPIPFGPYLAGAGWLALLWEDALVGAYLRWSGLG
ncbi:MAG: prepilin peptidase [Ectothiorhodospiraceae bacterium]|nr:prepilin peptidase [Ectothiorhodospiraceae bacterium]MCH8502787.1 A24 family peptidase [Ectothiorhodospiraceae bacterium]